MFERPALFGPLTVTGGLFPSQVAIATDDVPRHPRGYQPGTAVLLLNTRSRPTWLSPTIERRRAEHSGRAPVLPVMIDVAADRVCRLAVPGADVADPEPERDRAVRDAEVVHGVDVADAIEDEREVRRAPSIAKSWPTVHGAARSVRADPPGLHRLGLRREEVVPDRETLGVDSVGEAQELDVVADRDAGDVEAGVPPRARSMSCLTAVSKTSAPDSSPAAMMSWPTVELHDARSRVVLEASRRGRRSVPETSAPAWSLLNQVMSDRPAGHGAVAAGWNNQVVRRAREGLFVTCEQTTSGGPAADT